MSEAAILSYGTPDKPEHAVVYVGEWDELPLVLESPVEYFRFKGMSCSPIAWSLLQGVTVVIEPVDHSSQSLMRSAFLLGWQGPSQNGENGGAGFVMGTDAYLRQAAAFLNGPTFSAGAFYAEFALYTHTLIIRYRRPDQPAANTRFGGKLTDSTHAPIVGRAIGNLHFDIVNDLGQTAKHRANLIVDYLEDPSRLVVGLGGAKFSENPARTAPIGPGSNLQIGTPAQSQLPQFDVTGQQPRVVLEGASVPELPPACCVCIDVTTFVVGTTVLLGDLLVKCYACP